MFSKILFILLFASGVSTGTVAASESCQACHGDFRLMSSLGRRDIAFSANEIQSQTRMDATCSQCHLGNPAEKEKSAAHKGILRPLVILKKGLMPLTSARKSPLGFGSNQMNRIYATVEKDGKSVKDPRVAALSWHDKRRDSRKILHKTIHN